MEILILFLIIWIPLALMAGRAIERDLYSTIECPKCGRTIRKLDLLRGRACGDCYLI